MGQYLADYLNGLTGAERAEVVAGFASMDYARLYSGAATVEINKVGAEARTNRWLDTQLYAYGTMTGNADPAINSIYIGGDVVAMSDTMSAPLAGFYVLHAMGGAAAKGPRAAIHARAAVVGRILPTSNNDVVSLLSTGYSTANQGGSGSFTVTPDTGYKGSLFGGNDNIWLARGATFYRGVYGREVTVSIESGASAYSKFGLTIPRATIDAAQALEDDAAFAMPGQDNLQTFWKKGIQFGASWGQWPFDPNSTLVGARKRIYPTTSPETVINAGYGIDLREVTFATAAFASTGFLVDPDGDVQAKSLALTDGITAPTATVGFAKIYVDAADGDLKVIFGDGKITTIASDT